MSHYMKSHISYHVHVLYEYLYVVVIIAQCIEVQWPFMLSQEDKNRNRKKIIPHNLMREFVNARVVNVKLLFNVKPNIQFLLIVVFTSLGQT